MSWDDDDFEPPPVVAEAPKKQWELEDKEDWETAEPAPVIKEMPSPAGQQESKPKTEPPKPKAAPAKKAAGKAAAKTSKPTPSPTPKKPAEMTPEEKARKKNNLNDKERRRRQDEIVKSDFENAKDIFSGVADEEKKVDSLADFVPITESDFETFATLLADKAAPYKGSYHYMKFLRLLIKKLTDQLRPEDAQDLCRLLNVITNERIAAEKAKDNPKSKAKKKTSAKKVHEEVDLDEDFVEDELDAFM